VGATGIEEEEEEEEEEEYNIGSVSTSIVLSAC
jgi:hypothetical protein